MFTNVGCSPGRSLAWAALLAFPVFGCGGEVGEDTPTLEEQAGAQTLSEEAQLLVDQGNSALREERFEDALALFGQVLTIHPDHPVPQFGELMAATAVGDTALAIAMREKLAITGPELLEMFGPEGAGMGGAVSSGHMPTGGMPPGHPAVDVEALPDDTTSGM